MTPPVLAALAPGDGLSARLPVGDHRRAEALLDQARRAGIDALRLPLAGEDWRRPDGPAWFRWLARQAAAASLEVTVALYRHAPAAQVPAPPARLEADTYVRLVAEAWTTLAADAAWLELADPLGPAAWPDLSEHSAALLARLAAENPEGFCLGGLPLDAGWLRCAAAGGLLRSARALAFEVLPDTVDDAAAPVCLDGFACWATVAAIRGPVTAPLQRRYLDVSGHLDALSGAVGRTRRQDAAAPDRRLRERIQAHSATGNRDYDLVVGGAGFIGSNLAAHLARTGRPVLVFDNLSRAGTERNLAWLLDQYPGIEVLTGDLRDPDAVERAVARARTVYHFAAQVAVTTSLEHPRLDHDVNTGGTLNLLEAARRRRHPPRLVFTSTNKVYGDLADLRLRPGPRGYEPEDDGVRRRGLDESRPLAFSSPYGCSKGAADQYVLDYAHTFGLPAAVLRMSCIYGPRQFGNEDQGWVAHFVRCALRGEPITFYGDGLQVRDLLYVDDLVEALLATARHLPALAGEAFNIGGGPDNVLSLRALVERLGALPEGRPAVRMQDWRPSDQRYYVSDTGKFRGATGWRPRVGIDEGLRRLTDWMRQEALGPAAPAPQPGRVAL